MRDPTQTVNQRFCSQNAASEIISGLGDRLRFRFFALGTSSEFERRSFLLGQLKVEHFVEAVGIGFQEVISSRENEYYETDRNLISRSDHPLDPRIF